MITYEELLNNDLQLAFREGDMFFQGEGRVQQTLKKITQRLQEIGVDYAIAGGMAMYAHGLRRYTEDVDVLVTPEGLAKLHEKLDGLGYVRPFATSKNLRDSETGVRIDFLVTGQYPGDGKQGPIAFPVPSMASKEIDAIRIIDIVPLIELKLASGKAAHRGKDLDDVQALIQARSLPRELSEQLDPSVRDAYLLKWGHAQVAARDEF